MPPNVGGLNREGRPLKVFACTRPGAQAGGRGLEKRLSGEGNALWRMEIRGACDREGLLVGILILMCEWGAGGGGGGGGGGGALAGTAQDRLRKRETQRVLKRGIGAIAGRSSIGGRPQEKGPHRERSGGGAGVAYTGPRCPLTSRPRRTRRIQGGKNGRKKAPPWACIEKGPRSGGGGEKLLVGYFSLPGGGLGQGGGPKGCPTEVEYRSLWSS